jgi:alginate O-acetyltransferase complex protein AlgJ
MKIDLSMAPGISVILMMALGVPIFVHYVRTPALQALVGEHQSVEDILTGVTAGKLERVYKDEFPIRTFATGGLNAISLGLFHEARKGVVVGTDNWYFSDEEFARNRSTPEKIEKNLAFVRQVSDELAARNVRLVIALLPEKADIYRDELGSVAPPTNLTTYYEEIRGRLLAMNDVIVPDLRADFIAAREQNQLFLKSDTHWTHDGARISAEALARAMPPQIALAKTEFAVKEGATADHFGDLYKFIELSVFKAGFDLPPDRLTAVTAEPVADDLDSLLGDGTETAFEVAVVGTSYTANAKWGFVDQLKAALSADIVNFAEEGQGPFGPMKTFLAERLPSEKSVKVVVWEMPLRYFGQ